MASNSRVKYNEYVARIKAKLIIDPEVVVAYISTLDFNISTDKLVPLIYDAQRIYLEPALGTSLYNKIQGSSLELKYALLRDDYVLDILIHYTMANVYKNAGIQVSEGGIFSHQSEDSELVDKVETDSMSQFETNRAVDFEKRMVDFLLRNKATYPEYSEVAPGGIGSTNKTTANYAGNWYLGDVTSCITESTEANDSSLFIAATFWGESLLGNIDFDYTTLENSASTLPNVITAQPENEWYWLVSEERADIYQVGVKIPLGSFDDADQLTQVYVYGEYNGLHYIRINIADTYESPVSFDIRKY